MIDLRNLIITLTFLVVVAAKSTDIGRIVGGSNSKVGQFPYQVSLRVYNIHNCGGSIISTKHILTAAHCVVTRAGPYDVKDLNIRAGSHNRLAGGVIIPVKRCTVHEAYKQLLNDIAILELKKELIYSHKIQPILLATKEVPDGESVLISGWGQLETGVEHAPIILQWNIINVLNNAECCKKIDPCEDSIICLSHRNGNGACFGDSGGPAVYNGTLVGVSSFVFGGCGSNNPDGFAKVSHHIDWIRKHMN